MRAVQQTLRAACAGEHGLVASMSAWRRRPFQRRLITRLLATIKEWHRRAEGRRELVRLSDRALRDFGLSRYDAYYEARKPFWRA